MERAAASASTSASDVRLLVFDFDLTILSMLRVLCLFPKPRAPGSFELVL